MSKKPVIVGRKTWPVLYKRTAAGKTQTWKIWVEPDGDVGVIRIRHGLEEGKKQNQEERIEEGKNRGRSNETTPFEQAVLEAEARWNRQINRNCYGRTVEDSDVARAAAPMLAHNYQDHYKKVDWETAFMQPKLNGHRMLATRSPATGKVVLRSRKGDPYTGLDHIAEALEAVLPEGATLDGELYAHGMSLQKIASAGRRKKSKAAHAEELKFHVYDLVAAMRFASRFKQAREILAAGPAHVELVETVVVRSRADLAVCERRALDDGYEGAILRHGVGGYESGDRTTALLKVKTFVDEEFEVIDAKQGKSTYKGMCVFICKTAAGHEFEATAPGTHDEKRAFWADHKKYIGRRLTIKFETYSDGDCPVPLKPVALGFRED